MDLRKGKGDTPIHILQGELHTRLLSLGYDLISTLSGYGLTETSPTTHLLPVEYGLRKVGSIGLLLPNLEARLVVDGEGNGDIDAKPGEPGELWVRSPSVMKVIRPILELNKWVLIHHP